MQPLWRAIVEIMSTLKRHMANVYRVFLVHTRQAGTRVGASNGGLEGEEKEREGNVSKHWATEATSSGCRSSWQKLDGDSHKEVLFKYHTFPLNQNCSDLHNVNCENLRPQQMHKL